ncbi:nitrate- and nitrite sensing domain-containing protein [Nocardia sp. NBC_00511]|uniref:sensor histidine kinase n=1 Tax=Nocardia sp. NBC_00511 TaxID=2903591 RepID=UPI0030DFA2DB
MGSWRNLRQSFGHRTDSSDRRIRGWLSVRVRLLSIVLISSVTLMAIGIGAAVYLVETARESKQWAELASSTTSPAILMVSAFQEERRLSMLRLAGDPDAATALVEARQHSDAGLAAVKAKGDAAAALNPDGSAAEIEGYSKLFAMVPTIRAGVDARQAPADQVFAFFTGVIGTIIAASMLAARVAPEAKLGIELSYGVEPLRAAEALSQADTLGAVALTEEELSSTQLVEFSHRVGEFRGEVAYAASVLKGQRLDQLTAIMGGPAWQQVTAMQDAILVRGPFVQSLSDSTDTGAKTRDTKTVSKPAPLPMSLAVWQDASGQVGAALQKLWEDQSRDAHVVAREQGDKDTRNSILGGTAVALVATLAFLAALVLANRFIGRMRRLRRDTLELADERMPELINRIGRGETVDAAEVTHLDFGTDEVGQVARAFNRAHLAAVNAAAAEARTHAGINALFLNIAHRSQGVVHRQLALLDRAEREERNADQLELLFQLDHLATRARRSAENLIILGGEQPGRRWRNPVALVDLVRGAVAESLDYKRIEPARMPEVWIASHAVADVIHLLAELMDNATACSPPQSAVAVSAVVVGRGVAVEVIDQGLGMSEAEFAQRNTLLASPPTADVVSLSGDSRLGLFVVAKLAVRHHIAVRLADSVYGGVRAVVLIPTALLVSAARRPEPNPGIFDWPTEPQTDSVPMPRIPSFQGNAGSATATRPRTADARPPMAVISLPASPQLPGDRPELPRRQRNSAATGDRDPAGDGSAPADGPAAAPADGIATRHRTADEARNRMSAISQGSRQGRRPLTDPDSNPRQ